MKNNISREREYTYKLEQPNLKRLLNIFMNTKYIHVDEITFVVENPQIKSELHMISSKDYHYNGTPEGTKHRLKFKYKNNGDKVSITYSPKTYIDGKRYEKKIKLKKDFDAAYSYVSEMLPINHVLYKHSYEFTLIDHLNLCRMLISLDCCYAVNPSNSEDLSEPLFFLEIEEKGGMRLEQFLDSDFFKNNILELIGSNDNSNSKVVITENLYHGKSLKIENAKSLKDYVFGFYKCNNTKINCLKEDSLAGSNMLSERGQKKDERGIHTEKEFKFLATESQLNVIKHIKSIIPPNWFLIKVQERLICDIYYDTIDLDFYKNKHSFRIRKRGKGVGWISCLKTPDNSIYDYLERKTIRTAITSEDALRYETDNISGEAYKNAKKVLEGMQTNEKSIMPVTYVSQYRERYVIRSFDYTENDLLEINDNDLKDEHYLIRTGEMLNIMFDTVKAYDIRNIDKKRLIHFGELNISNVNLKATEFVSCEIEPSHRLDIKSAAEELFNNTIHVLRNSGCKQINQDKYQLSIETLNIME
ncbi:MAG: CYTH domain-containing protein [Defluviitaleaceae bacterium]|nr:CYTH domain-containing protein [Defluviitaleaceae bacterium]